MNLKVILSMVAGVLVLVGCGTLADKIDPIVKSGKIDQSTLNLQDTNRDR